MAGEVWVVDADKKRNLCNSLWILLDYRNSAGNPFFDDR